MTANVTCKVCNLCLQARVTQVTCRRELPAVFFSALKGRGFGGAWHPNEVPAEPGPHRGTGTFWGLGTYSCPHCLGGHLHVGLPAYGTGSWADRGWEAAGPAGGEFSCSFLGRYPCFWPWACILHSR